MLHDVSVLCCSGKCLIFLPQLSQGTAAGTFPGCWRMFNFYLFIWEGRGGGWSFLAVRKFTRQNVHKQCMHGTCNLTLGVHALAQWGEGSGRLNTLARVSSVRQEVSQPCRCLVPKTISAARREKRTFQTFYILFYWSLLKKKAHPGKYVFFCRSWTLT